jgi:hypothetical protein
MRPHRAMVQGPRETWGRSAGGLAGVLGVAAEDIRVRESETASCDKDRACGEPGGINHK